VSLQPLVAGGVVVSASISGGSVSAKEEGGQPGSDGCSRSSSQEVVVPDLCPSEQLQQQQVRLASDQGSVGWEDWGSEQQQQHQHHQQQQCNGVSQLSGVQESADGVGGASSGCSSGSRDGVPGSGSSTAAASSNTAAAAAGAAAAAMRSSESGAGGTSRLGDPRRSRHFLDLHSDSPRSSVGEDMGDLHHHLQHHQQQQQPLPSQQALQSLHQPQLLSYSGTGSASSAAAGGQSGPGMGAEGVSGASSSIGGMHSSSSGGGGGLWLEPHGGGATPPSWGATPRSTPHQHAYSGYSASATLSAGVTPRAAPSRPPGGRGVSHSSNSYYHGYGSNTHGPHSHQHGYQQQGSGRRSADVPQHHHGGYAQLHHQHVQQHLVEGSSGGGSGMFSPLSRLADSSYRR
jgi:hypothetical protein